ncbi:MAG TPA: hypothetical protein VFH27_11995 [Longimicrobiaceae bacterium]|nr:hypothetical protein [Longimicrobiaceae bacterium]
MIVDTPNPYRLKTRDESYHLTPEQRAEIRPGMKPELVERLLAWLPADQRDSVLVNFTMPRPSSFVEGEPIHISVPYVMAFQDPVLNEALEAIWAPQWEAATDDELIRASQDRPWPGLEKEKQRRHLHGGEKRP